MSESCFNCGLPWTRVWVRLPRKAENAYECAGFRQHGFCSEECAYQSAFLGLHTVSTKETITRFLAGKPVRYEEFRGSVKLELTRNDQTTVSESPRMARKGP